MVSGLTFKSLIHFELTFEGTILFSSLKKKKPYVQYLGISIASQSEPAVLTL